MELYTAILVGWLIGTAIYLTVWPFVCDRLWPLVCKRWKSRHERPNMKSRLKGLLAAKIAAFAKDERRTMCSVLFLQILLLAVVCGIKITFSKE